MLELDRLLQEQTRYYEDRAPEYEDVWFRRGPYDLGPQGNARWFEETARLEAAADAFGATGEVLELACGTGLFTRRLVRSATRLTAIDVSARVLEINRRRVGDPSVTYVHGDLFAWEPPDGRRFDAIFSSFLISHIPPSRFEEFWGRLERWLAPGGRAFVCDDLEGGESRPSNPGRSVDEGPRFLHRRKLRTGREYTIVKVFYRPERLAAMLHPLGWGSEVGTTGDEFFHMTAWPERTR
ncbi:MAG: class I SAM-dependent methyltransferase [Planctomycetaceae bacterium]